MEAALLQVLQHRTHVTFPAVFSLINKDWYQIITSHDIWSAMMKFYIRYRRLLARKRRKLRGYCSRKSRRPVGWVNEDRYSDTVWNTAKNDPFHPVIPLILKYDQQAASMDVKLPLCFDEVLLILTSYPQIFHVVVQHDSLNFIEHCLIGCLLFVGKYDTVRQFFPSCPERVISWDRLHMSIDSHERNLQSTTVTVSYPVIESPRCSPAALSVITAEQLQWFLSKYPEGLKYSHGNVVWSGNTALFPLTPELDSWILENRNFVHTAMVHNLRHGRCAIITYMAEHCGIQLADINIMPCRMWKLLFHVAKKGHLEALRLLLKLNPSDYTVCGQLYTTGWCDMGHEDHPPLWTLTISSWDDILAINNHQVLRTVSNVSGRAEILRALYGKMSEERALDLIPLACRSEYRDVTLLF